MQYFWKEQDGIPCGISDRCTHDESRELTAAGL